MRKTLREKQAYHDTRIGTALMRLDWEDLPASIGKIADLVRDGTRGSLAHALMLAQDNEKRMDAICNDIHEALHVRYGEDGYER